MYFNSRTWWINTTLETEKWESNINALLLLLAVIHFKKSNEMCCAAVMARLCRVSNIQNAKQNFKILKFIKLFLEVNLFFFSLL